MSDRCDLFFAPLFADVCGLILASVLSDICDLIWAPRSSDIFDCISLPCLTLPRAACARLQAEEDIAYAAKEARRNEVEAKVCLRVCGVAREHGRESWGRGRERVFERDRGVMRWRRRCVRF